ncbi:hypothetical protein LCGC14_0372210 [marine sediment metagenome]|uniref:Uncharacterized protein n=1 Tax=marine sediment metagenome TaxID=412755 RepID=A0A0F9T4R1_9ZZZZ
MTISIPLTKKEFEKLKEDANSYKNWLKYVDNRGWTDILKEPLKIKEIMDKIKADVRYYKELNNGLNQACDLLNEKKKKLLEEVEKWKKSSDDFRKDLVESNKLHVKKAAEIKQLEEDNGKNGITIAQQDSKIKRLIKEVESHKGTGIMIEKENQILKRQKKVLQDEIQVVQKKYEAVKQKLEEMSKPTETWGEKFAREAQEK